MMTGATSAGSCANTGNRAGERRIASARLASWFRDERSVARGLMRESAYSRTALRYRRARCLFRTKPLSVGALADLAWQDHALGCVGHDSDRYSVGCTTRVATVGDYFVGAGRDADGELLAFADAYGAHRSPLVDDLHLTRDEGILIPAERSPVIDDAAVDYASRVITGATDK